MKRSSVLLCLILILTTPFFFFWGPNYFSPRSYKAIWDLGHVAFFCFLAIVAVQYSEYRKPGWSELGRLTRLFCVVLVLGALIELLQLHENGRVPDVYDVLRDLLGSLLGFSIITFRSLKQQHLFWRHYLHGMVLIGLMITVAPLAQALVDEERACLDFPVLCDFESSLELTRWMRPQQMKLQDEIVRFGEKSAKIQLTTAEYSGASFLFFPGNWKGYSKLNFSVFNPDKEPLDLFCRVHDKKHRQHNMPTDDRFHTLYHLKQGWHDLSIPLEWIKNAPKNRAMDMNHIENIAFFVIKQPHPRLVYLDHIYLSK